MTRIADLKDFVQGDTLNIPLNITDDYGYPVDITGDTFYLTLKKDINAEDGEADLQIYVEPSDAAETAVGIFSVDVTAEESNIAHGTYEYDFQQTSGLTVTTVQKGQVKVLQGVTKT